MVKHCICEGSGYKDVLKAVEKCGVKVERVRKR
jgi:hypothetical protein